MQHIHRRLSLSRIARGNGLATKKMHESVLYRLHESVVHLITREPILTSGVGMVGITAGHGTVDTQPAGGGRARFLSTLCKSM